MNSLCPTCRKMLYRTDACKGVGVECGRLDGGQKRSSVGEQSAYIRPVLGSIPSASTKSTAAQKGVRGPNQLGTDRVIRRDQPINSGNQAPPVDTIPKPRGRPRIHPDRKVYKADHERKRRARQKPPNNDA